MSRDRSSNISVSSEQDYSDEGEDDLVAKGDPESFDRKVQSVISINDDAEPMRRIQGDEEPMRQIQDDEEPMRRIQDDEEPMRRIQDDEEPMRRIQDDEEPMRRIQDDEEPMRRIQDDEEPMRRIQDDEEPIRRIQDDEEPMRRIQDDEEPIRRIQDEEPMRRIQDDEEPIRRIQGDEEPIRRIQGDEEPMPILDYTLDWISQNICARECYKPVKTYLDKDNVEVCHCYKKCADHPADDTMDNNPPSLVWMKHKNTRTFNTNAFGDVHVHAEDNSFQGLVKYVRIEDEIDMNLLKELLLDKWHIPKPDWVITVMGEVSTNSQGQHQFWNQLKNTILRLSIKKELWLVSEGIHYGLAKLVGKAASECAPKSRLTPIGVFGWGSLRDTDQLIKHEDKYMKMDLVVPTQQKGDFLSENVSHSILVDNGTVHPQMCSYSYMNFTIDMIAAISNHQEESSSIPSVILLYGGWSAVLDGLKRALNLEIPVIIMKYSGGFADILATGFENGFSSASYFGSNWSPIVDEILCDKLRKKIREIHHKDFEEGLHLIRQCLKKSHLFTICDLHANEDFFKVIIQALLKTKKISELCRMLDQFFPQPVSEPQFLVTSSGMVNEMTTQSNANMASLNVIMMEAILMDKAECVEFVLNTGKINLGFFTNETMKTLYIRSMNELPETLCKQLQGPQDALKIVNDFIYDLIPNYCRHANERREKPTDNEKFVKDMFIWAILSNRREIAGIFWKKGKDLIVSALVASTVLSGMSEVENNINLCNNLKKRADIFLQRAIGTLCECYSEDHDSTMTLLVHNNQWDLDLIQVCLLIPNRKITTVRAFRHFNRAQWRGKINFSTGILRIVLTSVFYPLICCLTLRDDKPTIEEINPPPEIHQNRTRTEKCTSGYRKCIEFFSTPIVKFIHYMIMYVAFLSLYGHHLLIEMRPQIHIIDYVLCVWVFSFLVEEIIQLTKAPGKADRKHSRFVHAIKNHLSSIWNIMDAVTLIAFIVGMIIRFIPYENCYEVGRLFLTVDYLLFFWRVVHAFTAHKLMGPMLVMIWKMIIDLIPFLVILFISIMSFAITQEALLFPNSTWSVDFVYNLPRKAFWQIFGQLYLEDIEGTGCSNNATLIENGVQRCPTTIGRYSVPIMLAFYILLTNVLLLNVIIARFSFRFQSIQDKADEVWAWQTCYHTLEYKNKLPVNPPLTLIWRLFSLLKLIARCICCCFCRNTPQQNVPDQAAEMRRIPNRDENEGLLAADIRAEAPAIEEADEQMVNGEVHEVIDQVSAFPLTNPPVFQRSSAFPLTNPPVFQRSSAFPLTNSPVFQRSSAFPLTNPPVFRRSSIESYSYSDHWEDELDTSGNPTTVKFSNLDEFEQKMRRIPNRDENEGLLAADIRAEAPAIEEADEQMVNGEGLLPADIRAEAPAIEEADEQMVNGEGLLPADIRAEAPAIEEADEQMVNGGVHEVIDQVSDSDGDHWVDELDTSGNPTKVKFSNLDEFEQSMGHVYLAAR